MKAYRLSVNLKLGLIAFAVVIAVASLAYTSSLVERLREREQAAIRIWARANEQLVKVPSFNPYQEDLAALHRYLATLERSRVAPDPERLAQYREAVAWAQTMPPADQVNFITNEILIPNPFGIPAIVTEDSTGAAPVIWRNVAVPDSGLTAEDTTRLVRRARAMADVYPPIPIELEYGEQTLRQYVHYDESALIRELRIYPYLQLLFVGLFVLVGYLGFSYVRRSEQSSLWVGMAKEAAHQLGTPISSMMGWVELLRMPDLPDEQRTMALDEMDSDIERLRRVANRFSDIGSMPKLEVQPLAPLIDHTAGYMRRRFPRQRQQVTLDIDVPEGLYAPLNAELFGWVIENLFKNALDAMETPEGRIRLEVEQRKDTLVIDVHDTGRGIDRRQWKNIFRPGYSTKKRGWGLGLSLAKRIVEDYHGGALTLEQSRLGHGSTFRITLPAAEEGAVSETEPERAASAPE
jgi:signal transduction histidine kinase